jgi:hypothetical protein
MGELFKNPDEHNDLGNDRLNDFTSLLEIAKDLPLVRNPKVNKKTGITTFLSMGGDKHLFKWTKDKNNWVIEITEMDALGQKINFFKQTAEDPNITKMNNNINRSALKKFN